MSNHGSAASWHGGACVWTAILSKPRSTTTSTSAKRRRAEAPASRAGAADAIERRPASAPGARRGDRCAARTVGCARRAVEFRFAVSLLRRKRSSQPVRAGGLGALGPRRWPPVELPAHGRLPHRGFGERRGAFGSTPDLHHTLREFLLHRAAPRNTARPQLPRHPFRAEPGVGTAALTALEVGAGGERFHRIRLPARQR